MNDRIGSAPDLQRLLAADVLAASTLICTTPDLTRRLLACRRAAPTLGELLVARIGDLPPALGGVQALLLGMDAAALAVLAARAGAVRHARSLLRLLDGAALRALDGVFGSGPRNDALRLHALVAGAPPPDGADPLEAAIPRDGMGCLRAWCGRQPAAVGERVMLLLPAGMVPVGIEAALGADIVDALVAGV